MSYTKKDKVLYYLILPHLENDEGEGADFVGEYYMTTYKEHNYEAEEFEELTEYIKANFEPGTYDIYKMLKNGTKEFYASYNFMG